MSKEIDKETKKREMAVREKDVANEKLSLYQQVYDTLKIADPEQFLHNYEKLQQEVDSLNRQVAEKSQ